MSEHDVKHDKPQTEATAAGESKKKTPSMDDAEAEKIVGGWSAGSEQYRIRNPNNG